MPNTNKYNGQGVLYLRILIYVSATLFLSLFSTSHIDFSKTFCYNILWIYARKDTIVIFDIHCHILPGVDDGARNELSMERMLRIADSEGIDVIVATPHFAYGREIEKLEDIKSKYESVRQLWKERGPQKELYLGNELFYSDGLVDSLEAGVALTMNGTRYILVEFPVAAEYSYVESAIRKLQYAGYIPIIAHVERYAKLQDAKRIQSLVDMGAYMQVNVSVILGKHGFMAKYFVMKLLKLGLVHFVGTDAHSSRERKPEMKQCVQYLEKKLGVSKAHQILKKNPKKMLRGERLNG